MNSAATNPVHSRRCVSCGRLLGFQNRTEKCGPCVEAYNFAWGEIERRERTYQKQKAIERRKYYAAIARKTTHLKFELRKQHEALVAEYFRKLAALRMNIAKEIESYKGTADEHAQSEQTQEERWIEVFGKTK